MSDAPCVTLRAPADADREQILAWRNQPEVARWMYNDHVIAPREHEAWFAAALADPARRYWIVEVDGASVGLANVYDIDAASGRCAWAYYLADPAVRGRGVGAFVEFSVIDYVFGALGLNKLWCEVLVDNEAVWRLHESFGFIREALFREHVRKAGHAVDVVGLGLLASEWRRRRPQALERLAARGFAIDA